MEPSSVGHESSAQTGFTSKTPDSISDISNGAVWSTMESGGKMSPTVMGTVRSEPTEMQREISSQASVWTSTTESSTVSFSASFQKSTHSRLFPSSTQDFHSETTADSVQQYSETTAESKLSDMTTFKKGVSIPSYGTSESNELFKDRSTESQDLSFGVTSNGTELTNTSVDSMTTEEDLETLQNTSSYRLTESVIDLTEKPATLVVPSGNNTESTVFPDFVNSTGEISASSQDTIGHSSGTQADVTTALQNFADASSESFLFVKPGVSEMHNLSVSNLTITSLFGDEVMRNSTYFPDPTKIHDVIMQDAVTNDANTAVMVTKAVTLAILAVGGVIGNALVIWSVVRRRHLHRPPFYYLLSLSLTDLSRAAFCLPLVLMTLLQGSVWRHGNSACDLFAFANSFFVLSSCVSLLDVAADRHLSLVYSRSYRRRAGGAVNLVVVLLGWTLAFLVAFPPVVGVGSYAFEVNEGQCTLRHKYFRHDNDTLGFLMVFTGLSLVTLFLYYRIFLALRAHRKMRPLQHEPARSATWTFVGPGANGQAFINWVNGFGAGGGGGGGGGGGNAAHLPNVTRNPPRPNLARVVSLHVARNQHVTRLFFMMTLTFVGLWLPYQVLSYWRVFGSSAEPSTGFVTVAAWLSYAQVAVCPLVYFLARGPMRRRQSRADVGTDDKQEYLLESVNRKK